MYVYSYLKGFPKHPVSFGKISCSYDTNFRVKNYGLTFENDNLYQTNMEIFNFNKLIDNDKNNTIEKPVLLFVVTPVLKITML